MIIIINGPLGIGKTETAWELLEMLDQAVMLDGDYLGAVHPFRIYDEARVEYLYQTIRHVAEFHAAHGYQNFVINYVFETPKTLARLKELLAGLDGEVSTFRLVCDPDEMAERVRRRSQERSLDEAREQWELERFQELLDIQNKAARNGDLGLVVDNTYLTPSETAAKILALARGEQPAI